jgi:hypothetical protein
LTHSDEGSITPQHGLPGHHGRAGLGIAAGDHAVGRGQQAHVGALLAQAGALGRQALLILPGRGQVGFGGGHAASADACSCNRASTAPALMKFCRPSST